MLGDEGFEKSMDKLVSIEKAPGLYKPRAVHAESVIHKRSRNKLAITPCLQCFLRRYPLGGGCVTN